MMGKRSSSILEVEKNLAGIFARKRAFLVGRGATGLMLLFESLSDDGGRVILPAMACPSLLASVLLTGRKPVIVDVDDNLNISPDALASVLCPGDIVVGVHLFGVPFEVVRIEEVCRERNAVLIEDAAQAVGGRIGERLLGTFGTASLLSFAEGKNLPTRGGGAILTDDDRLIEKLESKVAQLPERPSDIRIKTRELRDKLTVIFNEARAYDKKRAAAWVETYRDYSMLFSYSISEDEARAIPPALEKMDEIAQSRRSKLNLYLKDLSDFDALIPRYTCDCAPFRFSIVPLHMTGREVVALTEDIRCGDLPASNLYIPLNSLAPAECSGSDLSKADFAGWRILNLWVDDTITERQIKDTVEIIRDFFYRG